MSGKEKNHEESTRMIILGPSSRLSSSELVQRLHLLGLPLTIKSTCYGALVHGDTETVMEAVRKIRSLDPANIFTKERGSHLGTPGDAEDTEEQQGRVTISLKRNSNYSDMWARPLKGPRRPNPKKRRRFLLMNSAM